MYSTDLLSKARAFVINQWGIMKHLLYSKVRVHATGKLLWRGGDALRALGWFGNLLGVTKSIGCEFFMASTLLFSF